jgi:diguanylate cyclase (GGDEF)-like protein
MTDKKQSLINTAVFSAMMLVLIFFVYNFNIPNPNMILIAALVLSTSVGGFIPGIVCAALMMIYSLFFFSVDHSFFQFTEENLHKITVIGLGILINLISVGILKRNRDKAGDELKTTNEELVRTNEQLGQTNEELAKVNDMLKAMASHDSLTNLRNRYSLRQDFEYYVGMPLYVLFLDLDNFKILNDTNGHAYGDKILAATGRCLSESFRTSNCYRYGGDEFLVISENVTSEEFEDSCVKVRQGLGALGENVSFSGGYVSGVPEDIPELRTMIMQADEMLYDAKSEGRNCFRGGLFDPCFIPKEAAIAHYKSHTGNGKR